MEREESSSTRSGSNVFGSERRQKRSSPPFCAKTEPESTTSERRALYRRNRRNARRPVVVIITLALMQVPLRARRASETTSRQRSGGVKAPAATVLRGTKSGLPVRAEDFPMKAAAQQRPSRGCRGLPRSE